MSTHAYDALFYRYQRDGSLRSARRVAPHLVQALKPASVLDVGCGAGAWLAAHQELLVPQVTGVDGDYVDRSLLLIPERSFTPYDIKRPFDLQRQYDLVLCLEVAEHIPLACAETLVDNLARHGDRILFSAAVPGQGGEHHVNERPRKWWCEHFARRGFELYDFVRPLIRDAGEVESWYRYNLLFFARGPIETLRQAVRATHVPAGSPIAEYAPLATRLREAALSRLPVWAVTQLAVWKHRLVVRAAQRLELHRQGR